MIEGYGGRPYRDERVPGVPHRIPGLLRCAHFDLGGEGVAYHDAELRNHGSGELNPADGSYLNEFRMAESVGTSFTKADGIDDSEFTRLVPPLGLLYVGWTAPGNWLRYTVEIAEAGRYAVTLLHTSPRGGAIVLSIDDVDVSGPLEVPSTFDAADDVPWRQAHHWQNTELATVELPAGRHVLTLHTVREGGMNYATLDFARR